MPAEAKKSSAGGEKLNDGTADLPDKQDGISGAGVKIGSLTSAILKLDDDQAGDAEALFDVLVEWATTEKGMELYEAQEEAIMELVEGNSVLLTTPTGSGKTLVATAAIAAATARGDVRTCAHLRGMDNRKKDKKRTTSLFFSLAVASCALSKPNRVNNTPHSIDHITSRENQSWPVSSSWPPVTPVRDARRHHYVTLLQSCVSCACMRTTQHALVACVWVRVIISVPVTRPSRVQNNLRSASLPTLQAAWYTAPLKALVTEKFFQLVKEFGAKNVGLLTGDASVNPTAPIICCTAEVLANAALRRGRELDCGLVVADEFHFYTDPERGWAWQIPMVELPDAQFLLMSAGNGENLGGNDGE